MDRINTLNRFFRNNKIARSLALSSLLSFHCLYVSSVTILAPVRLTSRCHRRAHFHGPRRFQSHAQFYNARNTMPTIQRILQNGSLLIFSSRERSGTIAPKFAPTGRGTSARPALRDPIDRSISRSISRILLSFERSHWIQDNPATIPFHRSLIIVLNLRRNDERKRSEKNERSLKKKKKRGATNLRSPRIIFKNSSSKLFSARTRVKFRKKVVCSQRYLPFGAGVEWRLPFLPALGLPLACPFPLQATIGNRLRTVHGFMLLQHRFPPSIGTRCPQPPVSLFFFFFFKFRAFSKPRRRVRWNC